MKVLITGATGFVGRHLCRFLVDAGHEVVAAVRAEPSPPLGDRIACAMVGELSAGTVWRDALAGVEGVVHLAARTHVMNETESNPEIAYRRMNVEVTRRLANECAVLGVKRLVFMSSIKVNGEATHGWAFTTDDPSAPEDAYGRTKRDGEIELQRATEGTDTEIVTLRTPLVYGPGVKGNFLKLMAAIAAGRRLPLGLITGNRRSLVFVGNLCAAILTALEHPAAAGKTFLVSDGEDLSTSSLTRRIGQALGKPARLLPLPPSLLRFAGGLVGRGSAVARLTGSLQVDNSALCHDLDWRPPYGVDQGLELTADWFKSRKG